MNTYIAPKNNYPVLLDSVVGPTVYPAALTASFEELVPDRGILVTTSTAIELWIKADVGSDITLKVQGSIDGVDFYSLPIIGYQDSELITIKPHQLQFSTSADDSAFIFSIPLSGIIRYCRILVKGTGNITEVKVSTK